MIYRFGDFELDPASYRLQRGDEPVRLEPRILELLVYLLERGDRVVGKEEIFDTVWGGQAVSDSVLTRAIYEIRRALDDDRKDPAYVATIHGRGYRFIAPVESGAATETPRPRRRRRTHHRRPPQPSHRRTRRRPRHRRRLRRPTAAYPPLQAGSARRSEWASQHASH